jgi:hypothetical protein
MLLRRYRPPLWGVVLLAPVMCNLAAVATAGVVYALIKRDWAVVSIIPVWIRFAPRLLSLIDAYGASETRRALAVFGAVVWLVASSPPAAELRGRGRTLLRQPGCLLGFLPGEKRAHGRDLAIA